MGHSYTAVQLLHDHFSRESISASLSRRAATMKRVFAFAAATFLATSAQATLLTSWENDADGWAGFSGFTTTYGVTDGTHAAVRAVPAGWNNDIQYGYNHDYTDAFLAGQVVSVDVTPEVPIPEGQGLQIVLQLMTDETGVEVVGPYTAINNSGTTTVSYDYSSTFVPGTAWTSMRLLTNALGGYAGGNVAFDNLRVEGAIPEPTSLAALGLAGLLFSRRRRVA